MSDFIKDIEIATARAMSRTKPFTKEPTIMGFIRITTTDGSPPPEWAEELNREADRLDPLSEGAKRTPAQEWVEQKQRENHNES